jgi:hypothetical protein
MDMGKQVRSFGFIIISTGILYQETCPTAGFHFSFDASA